MDNTITVAGIECKFVYAMYEDGNYTGDSFETLEEAMEEYKDLLEKYPEDVEEVTGFISIPLVYSEFSESWVRSLGMIGKHYDLNGNCTNQEFFDLYVEEMERMAKLNPEW